MSNLPSLLLLIFRLVTIKENNAIGSLPRSLLDYYVHGETLKISHYICRSAANILGGKGLIYLYFSAAIFGNLVYVLNQALQDSGDKVLPTPSYKD